MKFREDVQTLPIEINVQSAGVSQAEQMFYTTDGDETEEQYWARKEGIRKNPAMAETTVSIQSVSTKITENQSNNYRAIQRCGITAIECQSSS